jgi:hypothetical protein
MYKIFYIFINILCRVWKRVLIIGLGCIVTYSVSIRKKMKRGKLYLFVCKFINKLILGKDYEIRQDRVLFINI